MRYLSSFVLVLFLFGSASAALADELSVNIPKSPCTVPATCTLKTDISGPGSPAEGSAVFPLISLAAGPWQFTFITGVPIFWGYSVDTYFARFGVGGSFQMTAPDKLTFNGEITGGGVSDRFEFSSADLKFDGFWANNQYASGELGLTFFEGSNNYFASLRVDTTEAPEPANLALLGSGIGSIWAAGKRMRKS